MVTLTTYAELEQGSQEWLDARCGLLAASTIGKLITPSTLKVADNETSRGLTMQLAAERNLDDAIKYRDRAEEALYRAEEEDNGSEP